MTKAERLIYLLGLLRTHNRLSLIELAKKCGISKRTMYRDLNSLSNMNIPVYFDKGYRMKHRASLMPLNLNDLEMELIHFSLMHSPLAKSQHLANMLKNIETKVIAAIPGGKKKHPKHHKLSLNQEKNLFTREKDNLIICFLKAIFDNYLLKMKRTTGGKNIDTYRPLSIDLENDGWKLSLNNMSKNQLIEFDLEEIDKFRVIKGEG